jgi:hypothetical protein
MKIVRLLLLVACASLAAVPSAAAAPTVAQLVKDRAEAAERTFQLALAAWKSNRGAIEAVYTWSVRWLDAALDRDPRAKKQAFADHVTRMQDVETEAVKLTTAGTVTAAEAEAAVYYRVEAELWAMRGKR